MESNKTPCPNKGHMAEFACDHKEQCWEPCGELGKSEKHAVVSEIEIPTTYLKVIVTE